jgi:hypothetical protein
VSLNLGHLVGYLELDDKKFNRSAAAADRRMTALQLHLKALAATNPKIQVDVETRKLDELKAKMADLKAQAAKGVDVRVEIASALIEIDRVQTRLRMLHNQEVKIRVDGRSALATIGAVGSKINGLWTTILGLGPMLIPVAAVATGGILAIGSASVSAAAGVGVLAAAFAGVGKAAQALSTYREAVEQAGPKSKIQAEQLALGVQSARAGAANNAAAVASAKRAYAKNPTAANAVRVQAAERAQSLAPAKLRIALQKQAMGPASLLAARTALDKSAYADQTVAGRRFVRFSLDTLAPAAHHLKATAQSAVLPGVERGLKSLLPLLPVFNRLVDHVGSSLGTLAARSGRALNDPFWRHFFNWLATTAGPNLLIMGHSWGMLFEGISRTLERFGPQGHSFIMWIDSLTTKFNAWSKGGAGSGFESFVAYIHRSGPAVVGVLRPLGKIIGELLTGLGSGGLGELHVFALLLDGIAHLPAGAIETIGMVLPGIILALKGMQFVNALSVGINGLASSFGNLATKAEGASATGALSGGRGLGGRLAGAAGLALTGLMVASSAPHGPGKWSGAAQRIGGGAATGAIAGASISSVVPVLGTASGAAIGAAIGGLAGLYKQLHQVRSETSKTDKSWQDYESTLSGTHAAVTAATRQMAYLKLKQSGVLGSAEKLGLTDRQVVQAVTGNKAARAAVAAALTREQATHTAGLTPDDIQAVYDATSAVGKARLEQLKMNLAVADTKTQIHDAAAALRKFRETNGTAKVGLSGYQKMVDQLNTLKALIADLAGGGRKPSPLGGSVSNHVTGGLGDILGAPTGHHRPAGQLPKGAHRALGGPVAAGLAYRINEMGVETFIPNQAGVILDHHNTKMLMNGGAGIDYDRLARIITSVRQMYGDVYMQPHNYNEFRRQMLQDQRSAGVGGLPA